MSLTISGLDVRSAVSAKREASHLMTRFLSICASKAATGSGSEERSSVVPQLSSYCSIFPSQRRIDACIVELGSGTGLVGLHLARLISSSNTISHPSYCDERRAKLILTDLPEVCPLITETIRRASTKNDAGFPGVDVYAHPLPWGDSGSVIELAEILKKEDSNSWRHITHIVCSDLVSLPFLLTNESAII